MRSAGSFAAVLISALVLSAAAVAGEPLAPDADLASIAVYGSADAARLSRALGEGVEAWKSVQDYEARFIKQETSDGKEGPEEKIYFKFAKPFKLFMGWLNTSKKGLQVFYERGRHDGKLVIHKPGLLLGLAPVIFLDQDSPWIREGSASFEIEDAGIGTFLNDFVEDILAAEKQKRLKARVIKEDGQGLLAEVEFTDSKDGEGFMARRVEVFFDALTKLPTRMSLFNAQGALIGRYAYEQLVINPGTAGNEFKKQAHRALFKMFTGTDDRRSSSTKTHRIK